MALSVEDHVKRYWRLYKGPVNGFPDQKDVYLGLFLTHLLKLPSSEWPNLEKNHLCLSLPSELIKITKQQLQASSSSSSSSSSGNKQWLVKLLLEVLLELKAEQICDTLFPLLINHLSYALNELSLTELKQLLKDKPIQRQLILRNVTLLSNRPVNRDTEARLESGQSLPSLPHGSVILEKYNKLTNGRDQDHKDRTSSSGCDHEDAIDWANCNIDADLTASGVGKLIEGESSTKEIILSQLRLIINTIADRSLTNYCKDYQLCKIISAALETYSGVEGSNGMGVREFPSQIAQLRRQLWLNVLSLAVVESFHRTSKKPLELVKAIKAVLATGIGHLNEKEVEGNQALSPGTAYSQFTWTFLVVYLINNLQYKALATNDRVEQSDLLNKLNDLEKPIVRITCRLLATKSASANCYGINVVNLLSACHANYKSSAVAMGFCSSGKKKLRKQKRCNSVHHQPILGSYRRFDCILEHYLFVLLPHIDAIQAQAKIVQRIARNGICCCTADRTNLVTLMRLSHSQPLTGLCLSILRDNVYRLYFARPNDCGLCGEKMNDNDCMKNEILNFYRDAIRTLPQRGTLMMHMMRLGRLLSFSVQTRLVLEVVWKFFSEEVARAMIKKSENANQEGEEVQLRRKGRRTSGEGEDGRGPDSVRWCLMIFERALKDQQIVKLFFTPESLELLIQCKRRWRDLVPLVCEIFFRGYENAILLNDRERDDMMGMILESIFLPCVQSTQLVVLFLKERVGMNPLAELNVEELLENVKENPLVAETDGRLDNISETIQMAVAFWRTLGKIIELREDWMEEYLAEHFMTKSSVFNVIFLAIVFVLDVKGVEGGDGGEQEGGGLNVDDILKRMDRLKLERDCDKYVLRECDHAKGRPAEVTVDVVEQQADGCRAAEEGLVARKTAVIVAKNDLSYEKVLKGFDPTQCPFSCDIFVLGLEQAVNGNGKEVRNRRSSLSEAALNVINSVRETTVGLINHYVVDNLMSFVASPNQSPIKVAGESPAIRQLRKSFAHVPVTAELRLRVGHLLDAALKVFVIMHSTEDFGAKMLPALVELKKYILEQAIDRWNSVEHVRTVTRTLESILKVAEVKLPPDASSSSEDSYRSTIEAGRLSDFSQSVQSDSEADDDDQEEKEAEDQSVGIAESYESKELANDVSEDLISFRTVPDDGGAGYEADNELRMNEITLSDDNDKAAAVGLGAGDHEISGYLPEGVCHIIMEILFELSKKCVRDPMLWSTNLNTILNHLAVVNRSLGGTEAILKGFALVLQTKDPRLRELQKSILDLIPNLSSPKSLTTFMGLFTSECPPVDLLLPKLYKMTVAKMKIEPICEMEFPTRNDNSHQVLCDPQLAKNIFFVRDYHKGFKLESPFTRAALIAPLNPLDFKPWTNSGFTVTSWVKWRGETNHPIRCNSNEIRTDKLNVKIHLWSVGGNKILFSVYVDKDGQLFVEATRPSTTLSKEMLTRKKTSPFVKRASTMTNLFLKSIKTEYPDYFVTKQPIAVAPKLQLHKWTHLAWSVVMFPEQIVVVLTVDGCEQYSLQIECENGIQYAKNANVAVLCVGDTHPSLLNGLVQYSVSNVLLFKKSIPELQVLADWMGYGPDFSSPLECQIDQRVANHGLVKKAAPIDLSLGHFAGLDSSQMVQDYMLASYSAKNPDAVLAVNKSGEVYAAGFIAFGSKIMPKKLKSFSTNLIVCGGLDVLLYLFARVVELRETGEMQALALKTFLEAAHRNMYLFAEFKRRHVNAISTILKTSHCDKSLYMLKIILDVAFDTPVLEVVDSGLSYQIMENHCQLLYPELIISTINNFDSWIDEGGTENVIEILFEVLIWLNVSSVRGGSDSKQKLLQANLVSSILNFCKMHVGGISSRIKISKTMAEKLVELLGIYGPTPPGADYLDELAKLLLLIHEPSCVFITQDRVNYYYLLAACPPDKSKLRLGRTAAERLTKGLRIIQRKRRAAALERTRSVNQELLWKPRNTLWNLYDAGVATKGGKRLEMRREMNVLSWVVDVSEVKEGDKVKCQRIQCKDLVKLNRAIHNRKVSKRRRTIKRSTPLYIRLGAHVRKKENKNSTVDIWTLNLRRKDSNTENACGASTLQKELLKLLQTYVILLPDNMVMEVLEHYVTIDLLLIVGNNSDGSVRSELLKLLSIMCDRLSADKFDSLANGNMFNHLANQMVIYPVTLEMVMTCRSWIAKTNSVDLSERDLLKRNVALVFLVAMLPYLIAKYENTLIGCLQLLSELYEVCPTTRRFLMKKTLLIPSLVKCWLRIYSKRPFLDLFKRPGSHLLLFSYQICKSLFLSTNSTAPSKHYPTIWDFLNGLDYVGTSSLAVSVRRGMRVIQAKILNGLLRQCLQRPEPHQRYMMGIRRLQAKSLMFIRNASGTGSEMKLKFNQLMEKSILFIQCKDSQYEPRPAEEDLVKTIIRLGLATRLKIGTVITWSLSPFRSIDLRVFVIKCLTHLMKSKHVKTYGLNISIIRIFTKKFVGEATQAKELMMTERNKQMVTEFARFLSTDTSIDLWALLKAMSKIDEISCEIMEDRGRDVAVSVHKYEAIAAECMDMSVDMTRSFVEAQNTERRDLINQLRTEKRHNYQWKALISRMTHEGAPFYNPRYFPSAWQMDETEGPSRVRLRMKRCFVQVKKHFMLPEFQELHRNMANEPPLQYLVLANMKSRSSITDQVLYNFPAAQIKGDSEINGDLVITETVITFFPDDANLEPIIIEMTNVIDIWLRRYLHLEKCVELFLTSGHSVLIMLHDLNDRKTFESYFCDKIFDPSSCKWHMFVLQQWREGQLTNWEYLTALNQLSGRSFQDLMQYPVFPWILADYESSILDLTKPESFRRLDRPIAIQHDECKAYYEAGYEHLQGGFGFNVSHFPYHFPCHYSNSGTVLSFLIRIQPYTKMFIKYQDNHFDLPDRTFFSMHHAWKLSSKESTTDVKELLPEFYSLPEMFENGEGFEFGVCQGGEVVNHVNLPAWSNHSARLFTLVHRQALESDLVRENIRHWIDLIFGYKQTGQEAIQATNVFHSATYPDFVHPVSDNPLDRLAYATMVRTYGQMPKQLLMQPHPESLVKAMQVQGGATAAEENNPLSANCSVKGLKWGKYTGSPGLAAPVRVQLLRKPEGDARRIVCLENTNTVYVLPEYSNYMQGMDIDTINCVTWRHVDNVVRIQRVNEKSKKALFENVPVDEITCCGTHVFSNQLWFGYESGRIVVYPCSDSHPERLNKIRYLQNSYLANTMSYNSAFRMFKSTGTSFSRRYYADREGAPAGGGGGAKSLQDIGKLKWKEEVTLVFHTEKVVDIRLSPEFRIAVSVAADGRAAIWDTNTLEYVRQIEPPTANINRIPITLLAISQTMGDVITVHRNGAEPEDLRHNSGGGSGGVSWPPNNKPDGGAGGDGEPNEKGTDTDDESYEVTESNIDDFVKVSTTGFSGKTLMRLHTINAKYVNHVTLPDRILSVCFSHVKEGIGINVVATGFEGGTIKLWSSWDLSFVRQIDTQMADVIDLCFSTYQHLIVLTKDNYIQVWESPGLALLGNPPKFPQIDCKKL